MKIPSEYITVHEMYLIKSVVSMLMHINKGIINGIRIGLTLGGAGLTRKFRANCRRGRANCKVVRGAGLTIMGRANCIMGGQTEEGHG